MTPREFNNMIKGYQNEKNREMYFMRHLSCAQMRAFGSKITPEKLFPLHIDERIGGKRDIPTREETLAVIREFKRVNPKLFRPK